MDSGHRISVVELEARGYSYVLQNGKPVVKGQGTFGRAVLAHNSQGQTVIIKEVDLFQFRPVEQERARREAEILRNLDHPNIVKLYDAWEQESVLHMVMEFADGGSVGDRIRNLQSWDSFTGFPERMLSLIFVQICLALQHIHAKHILHRDLKADNVFLTKSNIVKLGDFGISTVLSSSIAEANTLCGTPYYFSPELCMNAPYTAKSDVWALGCLVWTMATLKHPFRGSSVNNLMRNILKDPVPPMPSTYSTELAEIVQRMLTKDPHSRPSIAEIVQSQFVQSKLSQLPTAVKSTLEDARSSGAPSPSRSSNSTPASQQPIHVHADPAPRVSVTSAVQQVQAAIEKALAQRPNAGKPTALQPLFSGGPSAGRASGSIPPTPPPVTGPRPPDEPQPVHVKKRRPAPLVPQGELCDVPLLALIESSASSTNRPLATLPPLTGAPSALHAPEDPLLRPHQHVGGPRMQASLLGGAPPRGPQPEIYDQPGSRCFDTRQGILPANPGAMAHGHPDLPKLERKSDAERTGTMSSSQFRVAVPPSRQLPSDTFQRTKALPAIASSSTSVLASAGPSSSATLKLAVVSVLGQSETFRLCGEDSESDEPEES
eukprot:TRINITY_DN30942_c0_g1_i1.p1 TRINITY_DN30942_c0_g1~~TRINITY_DN30942_c0_g1_i1.p1  ORF type:complete len:603 (+),score=55.03 TRINITY_DN30942_c0_g1_i1:101-1909(+)